MDTLLAQILMVIGAYLLGSINSAILVSKAFSLPDPRNLGSGNPGATNVLRTGNKVAAIITLAGDLLKGLLPVSPCCSNGCCRATWTYVPNILWL